MIKNLSSVAALALLFAVGACAEQDGPAEELGENIDEAAAEIQEGAENACEELADGVDAEEADCG